MITSTTPFQQYEIWNIPCMTEFPCIIQERQKKIYLTTSYTVTHDRKKIHQKYLDTLNFLWFGALWFLQKQKQSSRGILWSIFNNFAKITGTYLCKSLCNCQYNFIEDMIITLHNIIRAIKYKTEVPTHCLQSFVTVMRCGLTSFVQFKKREKYPWRSVTFGNVAG